MLHPNIITPYLNEYRSTKFQFIVLIELRHNSYRKKKIEHIENHNYIRIRATCIANITRIVQN